MCNGSIWVIVFCVQKLQTTQNRSANQIFVYSANWIEIAWFIKTPQSTLHLKITDFVMCMRKEPQLVLYVLIHLAKWKISISKKLLWKNLDISTFPNFIKWWNERNRLPNCHCCSNFRGRCWFAYRLSLFLFWWHFDCLLAPRRQTDQLALRCYSKESVVLLDSLHLIDVDPVLLAIVCICTNMSNSYLNSSPNAIDTESWKHIEIKVAFH